MKMKKAFTIALVLVVGIMLVYPSLGYSHPYDYGRGHYRPDVRPTSHGGGGGNGLAIAGIALGAIALGAIISSAVSQPHVNTRQVVYTEPVYAQPTGYGSDYYENAPPGQWVVAPGQWVNGQWIPAHKVWVPVNP